MHITLNREAEWKRALLDGFVIKEHTLCGSGGRGLMDSAFMITGSTDSFEHDHIWDRISISWNKPPNADLRVSCYASNTKLIEDGEENADLDGWLVNQAYSVQERHRLLSSRFLPVFGENGDCLICRRGRYLWIKLDVVAEKLDDVVINSVRLDMPDEKIMDYLPDIYREGQTEREFFTRFMAVFNNIFFELEEDINEIGKKLDYRTADGELLSYLASWLGIDRNSLQDEQLRTHIAAATEEYRMLGTYGGLLRAVETQTGFTPIIVEHFQVAKMVHEGRDRKTYERLFGTNPYTVYVILPEQARKKIPLNRLTERIGAVIPAHAEPEIVFLQECIRLSRHTYLGINSRISGYGSISTESVLYHDTYIRRNSQ